MVDGSLDCKSYHSTHLNLLVRGLGARSHGHYDMIIPQSKLSLLTQEIPYSILPGQRHAIMIKHTHSGVRMIGFKFQASSLAK